MKKFAQIFFLLVSFSAFSQTSFSEKVLAPLQEKQLFHEKVFIHSNKTQYFPNDVLWFKAYVGDFSNKPSLQTTRLYVNLLNEKDELIASKNVFIYEGTGKGQFELNSTIAPGKYYIQAYTNYMLNFNEVYLQEINIINESPSTNNVEKNVYDFQIFPEGGTLLENSENTVGVKLLVNGIGKDFSGKILNRKNEEVANFDNQHLGMSKCSFYYKAGESYTAQVTINDTLIKTQLPSAKTEGIGLKMDNSDKDSLKFQLNTNEATLKNDDNIKYRLLYHQNNSITGFLEIISLDSLSSKILFPKSAFFEGINTLTIFKGTQPVAERKFYIQNAGKVETRLRIAYSKPDSTNYKISVNTKDKALKANLSISVLGANPKNYSENQHIKSAFLLSPYVKGYIENPAYYFNKKNSNRLDHLDLLLLTQGWSKYSLEEMVSRLNPKANYNFEQGFQLNGTIEGTLSSKRLALTTSKNQVIDEIFLNDKWNFSFKNLLIYKGDSLKIGFLDHNRKAIETSGIKIDSIPLKPIPNLAVTTKYKLLKKQTEDMESSGKNWDLKGLTELEEVKLTGKSRSERYRRRKELIEKYRNLVTRSALSGDISSVGLYQEIPLPDDYKDYNSDLISYLRIEENVYLKNFEGVEYYLEVNNGKEALLYVDGKRLKNVDLVSLNLDMRNIENILMQPLRGNRIFQVFTTEDYKKNIIPIFKEFIAADGYDRAKTYFSPIYAFDENRLDGWTEIDWKPTVKTDNNGSAFFKIRTKGSLKYTFIIQGFTEEGLLISEIISQ